MPDTTLLPWSSPQPVEEFSKPPLVMSCCGAMLTIGTGGVQLNFGQVPGPAAEALVTEPSPTMARAPSGSTTRDKMRTANGFIEVGPFPGDDPPYVHQAVRICGVHHVRSVMSVTFVSSKLRAAPPTE